MDTPQRSGWRWLIALLAAAAFTPFLATPSSAATPHVTFAGTPLLGVGTAECPSTPDVTHLTVQPGGSVDFINHTGENAELHIGGTQLAVSNGGAAAIVFRGSGDQAVAMIPDCTLDVADHQAMTVTVCTQPEQMSSAPGIPRPSTAARSAPPPLVQPVSQTHTADDPPMPTISASAIVTPDVQAMAVDPPAHRRANSMLIGVAVAAVVTVSVVWIVCARRAWSR